MQALFALSFLSCISVGKLNHILRTFWGFPEDFFHGFFILIQFWICFDINKRILITTENIKKKGLDS